MIWLLALKGHAGSGKSTLGRMLSSRLGWPIIDKDDIKDILDGHTTEAGPLAYETMFNIARRQLQQGLNVICDSPLAYRTGYEKARQIATETHARLAIIECYCSDEQEWSRRINARKSLRLPAHHQVDWDAMQAYLASVRQESSYPISDPYLRVDTVKPLEDIVSEVQRWLELIGENAIINGWEDPAGSWHDLPDTMLEDLDRLHHEVPPTPLMEEEL
jgi:predicted kinase